MTAAYRIVCTRPSVYGVARVNNRTLLGGAYQTTFDSAADAALVARELERLADEKYGAGWFFEVEMVDPQAPVVEALARLVRDLELARAMNAPLGAVTNDEPFCAAQRMVRERGLARYGSEVTR